MCRELSTMDDMLFFCTNDDIISIDEESANEQWAKVIGANYQPYWINNILNYTQFIEDSRVFS